MLKTQKGASKSNYYIYLILFIVAGLFALIFCRNTSPLTADLKGDNSIFLAMGKMVVDGMLPYVDFFDHKGPVMFYIEALGQFIIPYRGGVFMVELLNLFLVLVVLYKTFIMLIDRKRTIVLLSLFLIVLSTLLGGGNFTEGFSLVPLFLSFYIGCKYYFKKQGISKTDGFILGLCFSFLFWLRVNNAGFLCGVCVFLFIATILDKDWKSLKNLLIFFALGQIPFSAILVLYFVYHDALYDLLYGTFIFNFQSPKAEVIIFGRHLWRNVMILVLLSVGTYLHYKKNGDKKIIVLAVSTFLFSICTSSVGELYKHYAILMIPVTVLAVMLLVMSVQKEKTINILCKVTVLAFGVLFIIQTVKIFTTRDKVYNELAAYKVEANDILKDIPLEDKGTIYFYSVDSQFYPLMEINSNHKYFFLPEWLGSFDENINQEINSMMTSEDRPLWVLMEKELRDKVKSEGKTNIGFEKIIETDYQLFYENDTFLLYKVK